MDTMDLTDTTATRPRSVLACGMPGAQGDGPTGVTRHPDTVVTRHPDTPLPDCHGQGRLVGRVPTLASLLPLAGQ